MPLKDVVGAALSAPAKPGGFCVRQSEIPGAVETRARTAGLIAQGKSNREIAGR